MDAFARLRFQASAALGGLALAGASLGLVLPHGRSVAAGVGLALVLALPSYWALSLTLRLSNARFFGAFLGGLFVRMLGFAVGIAVVWRLDPASIVPFALALVTGLLGLSLIEMIFIHRQNRLSP